MAITVLLFEHGGRARETQSRAAAEAGIVVGEVDEPDAGRRQHSPVHYPMTLRLELNAPSRVASRHRSTTTARHH